MKDIIERSNEIISRIKKSVTKLEDCEHYAALVRNGSVAIFTAENKTTTYLSTVLTSEQMDDVRNVIVAHINSNRTEALGFLEELQGKNERAVKSDFNANESHTSKEESHQSKERKPIDIFFIQSQLDAGHKLNYIHEQYYNDRDYSGFCKAVKKAQKEAAEFNDEFEVIPQEELEAERKEYAR